ncbi:MAG: C4-type zinc ribbon domain-containing protein [Nitrospirota bacterium]
MPSDTIEVSGQLKFLIELQETDTRILELQKEKKSLPEIIDKARQSFDAAHSELTKIKATHDGLLKEKRDKERAVEDEDTKAEKLKSKTSGIKTNKEYQAILSEIEAAQKAKGSIEDDLLVLLEKIENIKKELNTKEQAAKEEEKRFSAEDAKIKEDFKKTEEELSALIKERKEKGAKIDKGLLEKYTHLFKAKNGLAVAAVKNGSCLGCHMHVPPQTFTEVKKNTKIIQCFQCHRIHYWKE